MFPFTNYGNIDASVTIPTAQITGIFMSHSNGADSQHIISACSCFKMAIFIKPTSRFYSLFILFHEQKYMPLGLEKEFSS